MKMNSRVLLTAFLVSSLVLDASGGKGRNQVATGIRKGKVKQNNSVNSQKYENNMNKIYSRNRPSQNQVLNNPVTQLLFATTGSDDPNQSGNQKLGNRRVKKNKNSKTGQSGNQKQGTQEEGQQKSDVKFPNGKNQPNKNTDIHSDNSKQTGNTATSQQKNNVSVVNNNAPDQPNGGSLSPNIPGQSDKQSTQAYEPLIKNQRALLDKAADLLVFFGNGREKDRLNFNAMSIDQQNTVLDKAIKLVDEIHTNNTELKKAIDAKVKASDAKVKAIDAKVKASYDDLVFRQGRIISTFTDSIQELANAGKTFYDMYWAGWGKHTDGTETVDTKTDGTKTGDTKTDGTKTGDTKTDGTETGDTKDGTKTGDTETDGTQTDGTQTDGTKTDGTKTDGTKTDGTKTDGTKTDGTETGDTKTDGTQTDGTQTDGTKTDGTETGDTKTVDTKTSEDFTKADWITLPENLLKILKDVRESPRAVSALLGFYKEYYSASGNQITGGFFMTYNEALKHLTPLFKKSGVSEYELAEFAALFGAKQSFFAIVEKLQLKGFSIEKNKSLLSYYEKHMLGLEKLKSIKTIEGIKDVTSAHALFALLKSLKNPGELSFKSSTLTKLIGKEEPVSVTETITLIESLLEGAYAGNSITLDKLLEKVIQEVKDEMVTYYKDKDFGSVFDSENLEKNIVDESDVIKELVEHVKVDDSVKSHGKFFETNEKVLKLIAAKGDESKEYSKCLIDEVLQHGDDASILHVLALLDPENHAEIFNVFENKKVVVNGELKENNLRLFIGYVKQNQDKLFKNGVTFQDKIDVEKEIEHARQDYSGHESLKESCILLEAVRNNAKKSTPGTTTSTDRKE